METPEMRRMREYKIENDGRKRISTTEKNKRLLEQITQIIEHWIKVENKAILQQKQANEYPEHIKTKAKLNDLQKRRLATGAGKKK
jgi:hypothetical protein